MSSIYDRDLDKNAANHVPLSPLSFLKRAATVYPDKTAVVHGSIERTWAQTYDRCRRLASALTRNGIGKGDTVAVMCPNIPQMMEAHFGIPMTGAVMNALNTRLDAATIAFILDHGEAKLVITDTELSPTMKSALAETARKDLLVIDVDDPEGSGGEKLGAIEYEDFIAGGDPEYNWSLPDDEWDAITLNYTSGTTGNPKGVVYHHRGAYLLAMDNIVTWGLPNSARYLWTLPMFHCNGWCFPWTLAAAGATNVCLRHVSAANIYRTIAEEGVTHFCGAPIVLGMMINATAEERRPLPQTVEVMTAAAPPPPAVLKRMEEQGFHITHVYGLTEVYGPAVVCAWQSEWDDLDPDARAAKKARQGVGYTALEELAVMNPETMQPVPKDGETMGEVMFRGNIVMRGYLKNPQASQEAFAGGWFHSGDLGVWHPDSYVELKDRSKDIIISGGENISTIEVENILYRHPEIVEAAVVGRPDEKWGETPCAFVLTRTGATLTEADVIAFCRENMAHFKAPKTVIFGDLPKTSTGKVQKFVLRDKAKAL
ncbi:acyl-CoA synthetase [Hwanghaeella sp.]|uniref:acyl-CoA synthetase n=1 Tax=Hwanghaeella sp. TaxID=2605943 RepID=UPI003CCC2E7C